MTSQFGTCPHCGAALEPDSLFCTVCGMQLPTPTPGVNGIDSRNTVQLPQQNANNGGCCPSCGAPLELGDSFCQSCGKGIIHCPRCKAPNESDSLFCTACGTPLASPQPPQPPRRNGHTYREGDDDDDPTMLTKMVVLTADEARTGCRKMVRTKQGEMVEVIVPPYTDPSTHVDVEGYGLPDPVTGRRGKLRFTFFIAR